MDQLHHQYRKLNWSHHHYHFHLYHHLNQSCFRQLARWLSHYCPQCHIYSLYNILHFYLHYLCCGLNNQFLYIQSVSQDIKLVADWNIVDILIHLASVAFLLLLWLLEKGLRT